MSTVLAGLYDELTVATILTLISVVILIAFLNQRKAPRVKIHASICLLSSVLGTSLGWLALAISKYQEEASYLGPKLLAVASALIVYPFFLFGRWFVVWLAAMFKLQLREQRVLLHIGTTGIRFADILRLIGAIIYGWALIEIWTL